MLRRPGGFDGFTNAAVFVGTEIVHDDNVARRKCGRESQLDISEECFAVDGAVKETRSRNAVVTQGGHERRRFPVTEGRVRAQPFGFFAAP